LPEPRYPLLRVVHIRLKATLFNEKKEQPLVYIRQKVNP